MFLRKTFWWGSAALSLLAASVLVGAALSSIFSHLSHSFSIRSKSIHKLSVQNQLDQSSWIYAVSISPNGKILATGSYNGKIHLWNLENRSFLHVLSGHSDAVESLTFTQDSQTLLSGGWDNDVKVWDLTQETPTSKTLQGHIDDVQAVTVSMDGQTLVSGSYDGTIKVWDLDSGKVTQILKDVYRLSTLALHSNNQILVSGNTWGSLRLWDLETGQVIQSISSHSSEVRSVAFSPDGNTLVSGGYDKTVKLWRFEDKITLSQTLRNAPFSAILSVAISPDGRILASGGRDGTICLWEMDTGRLLEMFPAHRSAIWSIAFSPDGQTIISGSSDTTIRLWPLDNVSYAK